MAIVRMCFKSSQNCNTITNANVGTMTKKNNEIITFSVRGSAYTTNNYFENGNTGATVDKLKTKYRLSMGYKQSDVSKIRVYYTSAYGGTLQDITHLSNINILSNGGIIDIDFLQTNNSGWSTNYNYIVFDFDFTPSDFGISEKLTSTTSDNVDVRVPPNTNKTIVYSATNGYVIDSITHNSVDGITINYNANKTRATVNFTVVKDVVLTINSVIPKKVIITGTIINSNCNYTNDEPLDVNKNIIIQANTGYNFKGAYTYEEGGFTSGVTNNDTYLEIITSGVTEDITLNDNYIATKVIEQIGTFVNLYKVTQAELTGLSKKRIIASNGNITDYGQFINSLYVLPFDLPADLIGDRTNIILGNLDSNVASTLIATYLFDIDGGSIDVPLKYNNIYDFVNTECILHLPFLDKVFLNSEYVIGQTLNITFTIELYSGNLTANIVSSFNNEIVASVQGLIGMNIPFIQKSNGSVINSVSNVYKNRNKRCFVEVNRNIPYTKNNNVFGGSVVEYGKIGDYTGYLECDSLVLNTKATNQEQEEIKNIIRNGVFI